MEECGGKGKRAGDEASNGNHEWIGCSSFPASRDGRGTGSGSV